MPSRGRYTSNIKSSLLTNRAGVILMECYKHYAMQKTYEQMNVICKSIEMYNCQSKIYHQSSSTFLDTNNFVIAPGHPMLSRQMYKMTTAHILKSIKHVCARYMQVSTEGLLKVTTCDGTRVPATRGHLHES